METACSRRRGTVRPLFLLLILIVLMILPERLGAEVKIRSKIKSMSKRSSSRAQICSSKFFLLSRKSVGLYRMKDIANKIWRDWVPPGHYFMLGDSRDNSADARFIGPISRQEIVGRVGRVFLSFDPARYYSPRLERILQPMKLTVPDPVG
jgi:hypothetical protein